MVEQSINVALLLCDRALFLEKGQVRFRGHTDGLLDQPDILRAVFIGSNQPAPAAGVEPAAPSCRSTSAAPGASRSSATS